MRLLLVVALVIAALPVAAARADETPSLLGPFPDEDDPKLARGAVHRHFWETSHPVPRFKLGYRYLPAASLDGGELTFHALEFDYYPASMRFFRFGLDSEIGYAGGPYSQWYFTVGPVVGFQYPWRVTPFVEARFVAGLAGGSDLGYVVVSYMYTGGLDGGIEVYVANRFYLTASIGWAHPVYSGIDVPTLLKNPMISPSRKEFADDVFTFKVGIGL